MDGPMVHLAGFCIKKDSRIIQRCAICGYKLVDSRNQMIPFGMDNRPIYFDPGAMIEVEEAGGCTRLLSKGIAPSDDINFRWPENMCFPLVE